MSDDRKAGKLGRLPKQRPDGLHMFAYYQANPLPKAPDTVSVPNVSDWGMLGNDQYGDCTVAGVVHAKMANASVLNQNETFPTDAEIEQTYFQLTGGQDAGCVEAKVLQTWQQQGLFGSKLAAYAPSDHADFDELRSVIATFGLAYIGIELPNVAMTQFENNEPWDLTNTPADNEIEGGHCVILVGYDNTYAECITWGKVQKVTWNWLKSYMEESWAIITPEVVKSGKYGDLRLNDLLEDIKKL